MDFDYHLFVLSLCANVGYVTMTAAKKYLAENDVDFPNERAYVEVVANLKRQNSRLRNISVKDVQQALDASDQILDRSEAAGITILDHHHPYFPPLLRHVDGAPFFLYAKGELSCLNELGVGVIGSRSPSDFGKRIGEQLIGRYLIEEFDYTIISGLALGCDAIAHRLALEHQRPTIAVLPSDVQNIYPNEHAGLAMKIAKEGGCLLSMYPVGSKVQKSNFRERDRLMAAISAGMVVIESELASGTMHTATYADEFLKPKAAIYAHSHPNYASKGYAQSPTFQGNVELVENRGWLPLRNGEDIVRFDRQIKRRCAQLSRI
ncbi:DNA-processing protein DprA [Persicobacter psychrovividus]|uniref:Smf/DprA SLOG domain-containing protein n=1 Tax=Persicobacter psychrovividus TaxID=387638 RepID=A0ABN6LEM1_9BACT|nr:hypothetical protein PEPS_37870 [Persicobacter psychrovividus]